MYIFIACIIVLESSFAYCIMRESMHVFFLSRMATEADSVSAIRGLHDLFVPGSERPLQARLAFRWSKDSVRTSLAAFENQVPVAPDPTQWIIWPESLQSGSSGNLSNRETLLIIPSESSISTTIGPGLSKARYFNVFLLYTHVVIGWSTGH